MQFKQFFENVDTQKADFINIVKGQFPEAKFTNSRDAIFANIDVGEKLIQLHWKAVIPNNISTLLGAKKYQYSKVYINIENKGDDVEMWGHHKNLQKGSLEFAQRIRTMVQHLVNAGMLLEFVASDPKREKFFTNKLSQMQIGRISPFDHYWRKFDLSPKI